MGIPKTRGYPNHCAGALLCRRRMTGGTGDENVVSVITEEFDVGKKLSEKLQELQETVWILPSEVF